jgi:hypothetical protein
MTTTAEDRYAELHCECCALAAQITEALGDIDAPSETTNWANVGDLGRLRSLLREVASVLEVT